jgi:hypothetical protein
VPLAAAGRRRQRRILHAPRGEAYAGTTGFDPEAWCVDCQYYKLRRAPKKRNPDEYRY